MLSARNSVILVTGGCGFIGSNFINFLYRQYPYLIIVNVDKLYYCARLENVDEAVRADSRRYYFYKAGIECEALCLQLLRWHLVTHVINFAAQSHVQNSFHQTREYLQDNVMGVQSLLEACRLYNSTADTQKPLCLFVQVSTDEVYGESLDQEMTESSALRPTNPYAATKAAAEMLVLAYSRSYKLPCIITRSNNVYGTNQYPEKLIPHFIHLLRNGMPLTIQGDGSVLRSFLHVRDAVSAFDYIINRGVVGTVYNIGAEAKDEYSVMYVARRLSQLYYERNPVDLNEPLLLNIRYVQDRPFNDRRYKISNERLKQLGWRCNVDFDTGLRELIANACDDQFWE